MPFLRSFVTTILFAFFLTIVFFPVQAAENEKELDAPEVAAGFRKHCVQVYLTAKSADGTAPSLGNFASDIANLRSSRFGGYWWSRRMVLMEDPGLDDRFIHSIEISTPDSGERWPARLAGRFHRLQAILLEVQPNENGDLPEANPLTFLDKPYEDKHAVCAYSWNGGEWKVMVGPGLSTHSFSDSGMETGKVANQGIMVNTDGQPVGALFGEEVTFAAGDLYWHGQGLRRSALVTANAYQDMHDSLTAKLRESVLETRIILRAEIDDDSPSSSLYEDEVDESTSEVRAPGIVVGARMLLLPVNFYAASIARIENIQVMLPNGSQVAARFEGAIRNYMALIAKTENDICNPAMLPAGFAFLNPMEIPEEAFLPGEAFLALPEKGLFLRHHIDYELGRRREIRDYDRWLGTFCGFRDAPVVSTRTNEENGALAFGLDGKLLAVALSPRIPRSDTSHDVSRDAGFRPLSYIHEVLTRLDAFDHTLVPIDAERGKRLIALGVEWQGMNVDEAKLFGASRATRGGDIGLLVSHVYPGSEAEKLDMREQDILLRLRVEGQNEPIDLTPDDSHMLGFSLLDLEDMSVESVQRYMANMSPPWPSRENSLTRLLTSIGVGRDITIEYLREGEFATGEFTTAYAPPDYNNAPRFAVKELGITVKPITYEVARYFDLPEDAGVIVSKVEDGGRGSVAGLYQYILIVRVNGEKVGGFDDFKEKIAAFENGDVDIIELTVEGFGKTRLAKIER